MSTTFEVLPGKAYIPSFDEILTASNSFLSDYLIRHGIDKQFRIQVMVKKGHQDIVTALSDPAVWQEDEYAWFWVSGHAGGSDAYFWQFDELDIECWKDMVPDEGKAYAYQEVLKAGIGLGYSWRFRRSAGQPAIISLAYGMVAAAYAMYTGGLICSGDSAWDNKLFPAEYNDFLERYFNPGREAGEYRDWAKRCLKALRSGK